MMLRVSAAQLKLLLMLLVIFSVAQMRIILLHRYFTIDRPITGVSITPALNCVTMFSRCQKTTSTFAFQLFPFTAKV